ncbi:cytochrome c oxidase subunit II [Burkholderia pyrrocinia]|uniref:Cytochrome aa3 subunit 2 n=1 Tax=Burkholderia pyrrocinia TaxID=60550 RepID=A0A2Z5N7N1_BURPY|nr:cytochrome c oxidase subunit II [Burkholderia pyrrocinia]AXF25591.1 cytochrome c oxidase subunit II [Burkholderia pyrrocinia]
MKARHAACIAVPACAVAPAAARAAGEPLPLAYVVHAAGPAAQPVFVLGWALLALCAFVCIAIAVLLLVALFRRRPPAGGQRDGLMFVAVGSAISIVLLFGVLVYMLRVLGAVASPPRPPALTIVVTAYDWWWAARYPDNADSAGGATFVTANELHIPVGEPVAIELKSADVIHAFWVPQLAGKTQTIPGQTNRQWLQADRPGVYRGQCSQYCGAQHAHMAFEVVAEPPDAFRAWLAAQRQPAPAAATGTERRGQRVFAARCAGCHAVRGTDATGDAGPDLTHVGTRRLLAAGTLDNTPDNLRRWIAHAQQIKPQTLMPSIALAPRDADDLAAYLATLH